MLIAHRPLKAPTASNMKAVEKNLRKATDQAPHVTFDCRRMRGIPDTAFEREVRTCANGRVRGLKCVLIISRKSKVAGIRQGFGILSFHKRLSGV